MYRIHVPIIQAQGQCHTFMPSLKGYSFNSSFILTQIKENAQNTCPWLFVVPVMGLMTFHHSNQRHAWMPWYFLSFSTLFKSCYDNGWMAECNELQYKSSSNRALDALIHGPGTRSLRQPEIQPLCHSAVGDIVAL